MNPPRLLHLLFFRFVQEHSNESVPIPSLQNHPQKRLDPDPTLRNSITTLASNLFATSPSASEAAILAGLALGMMTMTGFGLMTANMASGGALFNPEQEEDSGLLGTGLVIAYMNSAGNIMRNPTESTNYYLFPTKKLEALTPAMISMAALASVRKFFEHEYPQYVTNQAGITSMNNKD